MPSKLPMFGLRIKPELLKKIKYIAAYNGRSANKEKYYAVKTSNVWLKN